jgi:hypothetical protein
VSGQRTTGPAYPLFQRYARDWPNLKNNIDYTRLKRFDEVAWRGTFLQPVADNVRVWVRQAIISKTFKKGTHCNLLKLIAAYLDVTPPGRTFKFNKPETVDNARFGQRANLYLTLEMLSDQITFLSPEQEREVSTMALISALLFGPGFLKSPLLAKASFNNLTSISHFRPGVSIYKSQLICFTGRNKLCKSPAAINGIKK